MSLYLYTDIHNTHTHHTHTYNYHLQKAAAHSSSKVIGLGHSFGGSLHMIAATRRPDLYERVILLDSPMFGTPTRVVLAAASMLKQTHRIIPQVFFTNLDMGKWCETVRDGAFDPQPTLGLVYLYKEY